MALQAQRLLWQMTSRQPSFRIPKASYSVKINMINLIAEEIKASVPKKLLDPQSETVVSPKSKKKVV